MKDIWTEHCHGVTWHDHEGGGLPHKHVTKETSRRLKWLKLAVCLVFCGLMVWGIVYSANQWHIY